MREQLGALQHPRVVGQLAEAGGEVVVPEQRHLLLQRTTRVDHPEHPPLTGIIDVDVGREEAAALLVRRIDLRVIRAADARVHIVGTTFVVHEMRNSLRQRHVLIGVHVRGADAEPSATQQMINFGIYSSHTVFLVRQTAIDNTPSAKVLAYCRRLAFAGPCCTWPVRLYLDPWHGQTYWELVAPVMVQPSCVHVPSITVNVVSLVREIKNRPALDSTRAASPMLASGVPVVVTRTRAF